MSSAAVLEEYFEPLKVQPLVLDEPRAGEVLVRIVRRRRLPHRRAGSRPRHAVPGPRGARPRGRRSRRGGRRRGDQRRGRRSRDHRLALVRGVCELRLRAPALLRFDAADGDLGRAPGRLDGLPASDRRAYPQPFLRPVIVCDAHADLASAAWSRSPTTPRSTSSPRWRAALPPVPARSSTRCGRPRGSTIAIFGTGAVGLSALIAARAAGAARRSSASTACRADLSWPGGSAPPR